MAGLGAGNTWSEILKLFKIVKRSRFVLEVNNNTPEYRTLKPYLLTRYPGRRKTALCGCSIF